MEAAKVRGEGVCGLHSARLCRRRRGRRVKAEQVHHRGGRGGGRRRGGLHRLQRGALRLHAALRDLDDDAAVGGLPGGGAVRGGRLGLRDGRVRGRFLGGHVTLVHILVLDVPRHHVHVVGLRGLRRAAVRGVLEAGAVVPPGLHEAYLLLRPAVQVDAAHEADVHAEVPVDAAAADAHPHAAVGRRGTAAGRGSGREDGQGGRAGRAGVGVSAGPAAPAAAAAGRPAPRMRTYSVTEAQRGPRVVQSAHSSFPLISSWRMRRFFSCRCSSSAALRRLGGMVPGRERVRVEAAAAAAPRGGKDRERVGRVSGPGYTAPGTPPGARQPLHRIASATCGRCRPPALGSRAQLAGRGRRLARMPGSFGPHYLV